MSDMRWLQQRARGWYAVKEVPRPLVKVLGKRRFVKSLGTRDRHVALARRHAALAEFQREIEQALSKTTRPPAVEAGMIWRETFAAIARGDPAAIGGTRARVVETADGPVELSPQDVADEAASDAFTAAVDAFEREHGAAAAGTFAAIATGKTTPLLHYVDAWLAEGGSKGPLNERTRRQYRSDLAALEAWARQANVPPTIEAFTRPVVGRFVTDALVSQGIDRGTANRKISAASSYWRWLVKRAGVKENPWSGQSLSRSTRADLTERRVRPFTDAEVATLLAGDADPEMADAIRVAALSGMRLDELYRLTVADCAGGWFDLRRAKTRAGIRRVPIHSALARIIARRTEGKPAGAFLFPEPGAAKPGRERSMAVSKRFGRYRIGLGVDERVDGRRHSRITFHSLRRWFVTKARGAGFDRAVVAAIVGHEAGNITDDAYSGGPDDELKRRCVEAVRLPEVESRPHGLHLAANGPHPASLQLLSFPRRS
jgi:integrase